MKYYLIAGEASGDLHAANLMRALTAEDPQAEFRCWGGDRMEQAGGFLVKHYRDLAFMGFAEVLLNLRTILRNIRFCKKDIAAWEPDVLVLIDYPGFNLRLARWARSRELKVVYYISPQIWAWKQKRVVQIKRDVDRMICILPFEREFYARHGVEVDYVGHPLLDAIHKRPEIIPEERKNNLGLSGEKPVMALLPGSRKQEIRSMLPLMLRAARAYPGYQVAVAVAPGQEHDFYRKLVPLKGVILVPNRTYDLLEVSDLALVTSGTATLETALFGVPQVVCYRGNWVSYWIARQLVKVPYISLVNLVAGREVVTELIQREFNLRNLKQEIERCREEAPRFAVEYRALREKLGGGGASAKAAQIVIKTVQT